MHPELTILIARNGSGKTSVIDAVAIVFGTFVGSFLAGTGIGAHQMVRCRRGLLGHTAALDWFAMPELCETNGRLSPFHSAVRSRFGSLGAAVLVRHYSKQRAAYTRYVAGHARHAVG